MMAVSARQPIVGCNSIPSGEMMVSVLVFQIFEMLKTSHFHRSRRCLGVRPCRSSPAIRSQDRSARATRWQAGIGARVSKGGREKRTAAEKRSYVRRCRPPGLSVTEGCRLMGIARSTFYDEPSTSHDDTGGSSMWCGKRATSSSSCREHFRLPSKSASRRRSSSKGNCAWSCR